MPSIKKNPPDHFFDNREHSRGRRAPAKRKSSVDPGLRADRSRDKRHQRRPFPYITLAAALKRALATPTLKRRFSVLEIAGQWESLVGETVAQHVQPTSLDKGTLELHTDSSVWRQQISLMGPEILEKMQLHFSHEIIKQIRVK